MTSMFCSSCTQMAQKLAACCPLMEFQTLIIPQDPALGFTLGWNYWFKVRDKFQSGKMGSPMKCSCDTLQSYISHTIFQIRMVANNAPSKSLSHQIIRPLRPWSSRTGSPALESTPELSLPYSLWRLFSSTTSVLNSLANLSSGCRPSK